MFSTCTASWLCRHQLSDFFVKPSALSGWAIWADRGSIRVVHKLSLAPASLIIAAPERPLSAFLIDEVEDGFGCYLPIRLIRTGRSIPPKLRAIANATPSTRRRRRRARRAREGTPASRPDVRVKPVAVPERWPRASSRPRWPDDAKQHLETANVFSTRRDATAAGWAGACFAGGCATSLGIGGVAYEGAGRGQAIDAAV